MSSPASRPLEPHRPGRLSASALVLGLAFGSSALVACYGTAPAPEPALEEMHAHFQAATDARRAAIVGDLVGLREAARSIYDRGSVDGIPEEQSAFIFDLRQRARDMAARPSARAAVADLPGLLTECAGCHQASGVDLTPRFALHDPPDLSVLQDPHGQGLGWALNRLWEGVLGPSQPAWEAGAEALVRPPAIPDRLARQSPSVAELGRQELNVLAGRAHAATDVSARASVLGDVLEACRSCHATADPFGDHRSWLDARTFGPELVR